MSQQPARVEFRNIRIIRAGRSVFEFAKLATYGTARLRQAVERRLPCRSFDEPVKTAVLPFEPPMSYPSYPAPTTTNTFFGIGLTTPAPAVLPMMFQGGGGSSTNHYRFTGKELDEESGLYNFGARMYSPTMGRFLSPDPITIKIDRLLISQRLNLYSYVSNNPLIYTDPDGRDLVGGSGDQKAIRGALKEIASRPGGREFLRKLDNLTAKIAVSTGSGLADRNGNPAYGKTSVQPGSDPKIQRVTDMTGKIIDVKSPNIETTVDFGLAKQDRKSGVTDAPSSDAQLLGHELKHDEAQFFKLPNSESDATQGIDSILNSPADKNLKKDADKFVDELLKPKPTNQSSPPPACTDTKDKKC